jgi:glycyl-tRNA synthetase beta chain
VDPSAVRRVETPKGEYVAVTVHHAGQPAAEVLPAMLAQAALPLQFPKTMRWDAGNYRFGRPVRWLVALFGADVLDVSAFGLEAGRSSFGHRFLHPGKVSVKEPGAYLDALRRARWWRTPPNAAAWSPNRSPRPRRSAVAGSWPMTS